MRILSVWINHGIELGQLAPDNLHQWLMFHWTMIVSVDVNEIRVFAWTCPRGLYRKCREIKLLAPTPTQVADLWRLSALVIAFSLLQIPGYPHFGAPRPGGFVIRKAVSEKKLRNDWSRMIHDHTSSNQKKSCHMPFLQHISPQILSKVGGCTKTGMPQRLACGCQRVGLWHALFTEHGFNKKNAGRIGMPRPYGRRRFQKISGKSIL